MTTLRTMNDVNAVYDQGIKTLKNGLLVCPMCEKTYKNELAAHKHVNERNCHKMIDVVKDTLHETKGYGLYKNLIAALKPNAQLSLATFRKSPMYNSVMRFTMFCSLHEVFSSDIYVAFLNEIKKIEQVNAILSAGVKEENLREFRIFAQQYDLIPSESYYSKYRDDLINDDDFFIRSIEKSRIGLRFLAAQSDFDFEDRFDKLPIDYQNRLKSILEQIV